MAKKKKAVPVSLKKPSDLSEPAKSATLALAEGLENAAAQKKHIQLQLTANLIDARQVVIEHLAAKDIVGEDMLRNPMVLTLTVFIEQNTRATLPL